ncbi:MAG: LysM peptidoglycan-binding domain-containing protein [Candidatus Riflebacteria bacterium]|nr:LysM peptidoglycan-binding domain-containing protein [Candidatus Riflebacteria bacterium]
MIAPHPHSRPAPQRGLFLFFVVGLFLLQIAFACTIHGDIGPQYPHPTGLERTAPEALIGHIDSLLTPTPRAVPKPRPDAAPAAASRRLLEPAASAMAGVQPPSPMKGPLAPETGSRYAEYTIEKGDTLDSISRKLYGNTRMVVHLVRLNRIRDDKNLRRGDRLLLPRSGLLTAAAR